MLVSGVRQIRVSLERRGRLLPGSRVSYLDTYTEPLSAARSSPKQRVRAQLVLDLCSTCTT